ncbi:fibronectin type III domain-containing protein [Spirosoma foliorum]|uniref:Fibronectin type III domain-containing protein n=1 Tax=Spirosoma foliorum TaxID=2710596 RepID=A0A7G5GWT0_9BACT|nr:fibronectin type III domain-containing protein [Spirosoma foliorum]QMW03322.1 fibronectin type III domain-containing protein [Spirosoma foliorum]
MTRLFRILFLFVWLSGLFHTLRAQNYPVQATPIVMPPYSLNWTDYTTNERMLRVYLLLKDLTKPQVQVALHLHLQGVGIDIHTRDGFLPSHPLTLLPGQPVTLTGPELAEYFQPQNLDIQGLDPAFLYQGGQLPEGLYSFSIEAYEYDRGRQVSNTGTALFSVFLAYPPLLTLPKANAQLTASQPQQQLFQWMPRNTASLNGVGQTLYRFRLFELWDDQDPNVTVGSLQPLYEFTTPQTALYYGPAEPPLVPGRRYAWQVQAQDLRGRDGFINQGYSEVASFTYGSPWNATDNLTISPVAADQLRIGWPNQPSATGYRLRWAVVDPNNGALQWQQQEVVGNGLLLTDLKPGQAYQFQVQTLYGADQPSLDSPLQAYSLPGEYTPDWLRSASLATAGSTTGADESLSMDTPITVPLGGTSTSLPKLDENATTDQLREAINAKEPQCNQIYNDFVCGRHPQLTVPPDIPIRSELKAGDAIGVGDVRLILTSVSPLGNSYFQGAGLIKLPFMNNVKVGVSFDRIKVSEGGCVVDGQVKVSGVDVALLDADLRAKVQATYNSLAAGIDAATALIKTPTELMGETRQRAAELLADLKGQAPTAAQQQKLAELAKVAEAGRAAFQRRLDRYVQEAGSTASPAVLAALADWQADLTAVQTALGVAKQASTTGSTAGLTDALTVLKSQTIEQTYLSVQKLVEGPSGSDLANVDLSKGVVVFGPGPGVDGGTFDSWNSAQAAWASRYQSLGSGYRVGWQELPTQTIRQVSAHLEQAAGITADKISFYGAGKTPLKATLSGNSWTIDLPAGSEGEEGIYAYYNDGVQTPTTVGKLQVVRYENQQEKVKIVMVGRAALADGERAQLETDLNRIYGASQTRWEVTVDSYLATDWDSDKNGLNAGDNATLSQYTAEMNALKRGYFQQNNQQRDTYYVFVVAGFSPATVQGYMPRGRGVGFISSGGNLAHTLAHELGHGAFGLEHTFDEVPQGSIDNLMDYGSGSRLTHWQWQQIQHPGIIISWFEDADDAALLADVAPRTANTDCQALADLSAYQTIQQILSVVNLDYGALTLKRDQTRLVDKTTYFYTNWYEEATGQAQLAYYGDIYGDGSAYWLIRPKAESPAVHRLWVRKFLNTWGTHYQYELYYYDPSIKTGTPYCRSSLDGLPFGQSSGGGLS